MYLKCEIQNGWFSRRDDSKRRTTLAAVSLGWGAAYAVWHTPPMLHARGASIQVGPSGSNAVAVDEWGKTPPHVGGPWVWAPWQHRPTCALAAPGTPCHSQEWRRPGEPGKMNYYNNNNNNNNDDNNNKHDNNNNNNDDNNSANHNHKAAFAFATRRGPGKRIHPVSITRFPLRRFSPGAGLLRNRVFQR